MWGIRWAPNNVSKWQMEFTLVFKGLITFFFKLVKISHLLHFPKIRHGNLQTQQF